MNAIPAAADFADVTPITLASASAALLASATDLTVRAWELAAAEWAGIDADQKMGDLGDCFRASRTEVDLSDWQRVLLIELAAYGDPDVCSERGLKVLDTLVTLTGHDAFYIARNEVEDEIRPSREPAYDPVFAGGSASHIFFDRI